NSILWILHTRSTAPPAGPQAWQIWAEVCPIHANWIELPLRQCTHGAEFEVDPGLELAHAAAEEVPEEHKHHEVQEDQDQEGEGGLGAASGIRSQPMSIVHGGTKTHQPFGLLLESAGQRDEGGHGCQDKGDRAARSASDEEQPLMNRTESQNQDGSHDGGGNPG